MISIIIPIFSDHKTAYLQDRLLALLEYIRALNSNSLESVVIDYSPTPNKLIKKNCNCYITAKIDGVFNPARARNLGVQHASGEYLFFHDVDLMYGPAFYESLIQEANKLKGIGLESFAMLPCLYLTPLGTNKLQLGELSYDDLLNSYLHGEADAVSHLAACSSAILMNRSYYQKLGGMDEAYQGHGCEDFDLIHKLVANQPIGKRDDTYYNDVVTQFPAEYQGFRKYMAYYSLPYLFTPLFLVHLYHERPLGNRFYFNRRNNESLLQRNMRHYPGLSALSDVPQQPMPEFIGQLMQRYGLNKADYPGLFHYKKGVIGRKGNFGSKLRKLITRPGLFITDSKLYKLLIRR